jgi:hypothetical protein
MATRKHQLKNALLSVFLIWGPAASTASPPRLPTHSQAKPIGVSESVKFCDTDVATCTPASAFSLSTLRDLFIVVQWTNLPTGTHTQEVKFYLPEARTGTLYQSFNNPFFAPHGHKKLVTLVDDVPVAGTFIENRELTGMWKVDIYLDDTFVASSYVELDP